MEVEANEININRYINNQLKGDELIAFEALLQKDKALQEKVNFHKEVDNILFEKMAPVKTFEKEEAELKPLLEELGNQYFLEPVMTETPIKEISTGKKAASATDYQTKPKPSNLRWLVPLLSLAAAAAILFFLFIPNQENPLFAKHFELPINDTKMSPSPNPTAFDEANKAYKAKNYKEAVELYDQFLKEDPANSKAWLYKGGSELYLNWVDAAILTFQQLANNHPKYTDIAYWYLALCYLKKEDKAQTKTILNRITLKDKKYYEKAQQLLKEL